MKKNFTILHTSLGPVIALLLNLLIAFALYFVARVEFLSENLGLFADSDFSIQNLLTMGYGGFMFDRTAILYTNMIWMLLMLFPWHGKETRLYHQSCKWLFVIVNSITLVVNLCDSVYFPFTLRRTTTSVFREFSGESNLGGIFLTEFVRHWYLVLLAVVLIVLTWKLYVMPRTERKSYRTLRRQVTFAGLQLLFLLAAIPLVIGGIRGGLSTGIRPITINNANQYVQRPSECAIVLNTPFALIRTIGKSVFQVPPYYNNIEEAAEVFNPMHGNSVRCDTVATYGADKGGLGRPNIVVLIVESFGREYIGALNKDLDGGHYQGYTPNVDRLIGESLTFRHSFANGKKSIDGMPSVLCSIPMFIEPFVLTPSSMNTYTGIAGLLSGEGYHTAFFHGANRGSMGFLAFANKIGFKDYFGRQDYEADPRFGGPKDFDTHWGIWDEPFLQYYCAKMSEMPEPFMTALFTVSSHHPFVVPDEYKNVFKEGELPIHKCIRYTDMAIGRFFEEARKQPWYANTVFVLTSDHTNQTCHDEFRSDIGTFSAPIIIFDPSGRLPRGMSESVAQQIDIMPTLLGLSGYDKPYMAFGIDLLNTPAEETFAVNYLNGTYQYVKKGYVLQFDGNETKAVYSVDDRTMQHNLIGTVAEQEQMERELKAIIYQYMYRMVNDQLL
ncbi:MAG: sulfatase-like hydrolase/transferase [Prevotella sp.]|nr:sulfatase-like hydrolase/transferase [Prevotella sp.]